MNRRTFVATIAALPAAWGESQVRLEAVIAPQLPASLLLPQSVLRGQPEDARLFELRSYRANSPRFASHFADLLAEIHPSATPLAAGRLDHSWLLPFASLAERENAWARLNGHPKWVTLREQVQSYDFAVYRVSER